MIAHFGFLWGGFNGEELEDAVKTALNSHLATKVLMVRIEELKKAINEINEVAINIAFDNEDPRLIDNINEIASICSDLK